MMGKTTDKKKENLISNLDSCLSELYRFYGGESISYVVMPILYVLVAHHHGKRFDVCSPDFDKRDFLQIPLDYNFDEQAKRILCDISQFFPYHIRKEISFCVADFYKDNCHIFEEYYQDIIDHILEVVIKREKRSFTAHITPSYMTQLLYSLVNLVKPTGLYDPCAGLCSIITLPKMDDVDFEGQEINNLAHVLAIIRLDAYGRPLTVKRENAITDWHADTQCDCLFSELPMGKKVVVPQRFSINLSFFEDEILKKFIETPTLKRAVIVVPISTCYRPANLSLRKTLCESKYVDMVIELPKGVLAHTGTKPVVLLLNKEKRDGLIKFISASDCLVNAAYADKSLDIETIMKRINGRDKSLNTMCSVLEVASKDYNLAPYRYLQDQIEVLPGQRILPLKKIASIIKGSKTYSDTEGPVLDAASFSQTLADFRVQKHNLSILPFSQKDNYVKIDSPCVILNLLVNKFFIKYDNSPLFIKNGTFYAFEVNTEKCSLEYFTLLLLHSQALHTFSDNLYSYRFTKKELQELPIALFEDKESQNYLVERANREAEYELKAKLEKLQELSDKSSDLLHSLGVTFTRMGSAVACLQDYADEKDEGNDEEQEFIRRVPPKSIYQQEGQEGDELVTSIDTLDVNLKYALRKINSTGTDFASITPDMEILDIKEIMEQYVDSWGKIGYGSFKLLPLESSLPTSKPTMVKVDKTLLYTALDCILANAHQHGFNRKADENNMVAIEIKPVAINHQIMDNVYAEEEHYLLLSVSNNGNPLPEGFTLHDFVSRGVVGINSSQDGLGGDHICKIAHLFGGKISIEATEHWLSFNILIPFYITPKDTEYYEYECESI